VGQTRGFAPTGAFGQVGALALKYHELTYPCVFRMTTDRQKFVHPLRLGRGGVMSAAAENNCKYFCQHSDLPRLVHSILLETGLAPDRLELEITEGVLIDESRAQYQHLASFRRLTWILRWVTSGPDIRHYPICTRSRSIRSRLNALFWQFGAQPSFPGGCLCDYYARPQP
jgi:hypothetical protein